MHQVHPKGGTYIFYISFVQTLRVALGASGEGRVFKFPQTVCGLATDDNAPPGAKYQVL